MLDTILTALAFVASILAAWWLGREHGYRQGQRDGYDAGHVAGYVQASVDQMADMANEAMTTTKPAVVVTVPEWATSPELIQTAAALNRAILAGKLDGERG